MTQPASAGILVEQKVTGLDVAALICAVLVAPVGLILGLVSRASAKGRGLRPNLVATASIVVGAVVSGLGLLLVAAPLLMSLAFIASPR